MKKKFFLFGIGVMTGVLLTILLSLLIVSVNSSEEFLSGLTISEEKGECIPGKQIEVFQVLKPNMALAKCGKYPDDVVVLLINYEGKSYYDNQKIKINKNQCARQIGYYKYTTKSEIPRNVPAVVIE